MKVRLENCQLCGGDDLVGLRFEVTDDPYKIEAHIDWEVEWSLCRGCSFLFQNPRLSREEQESFYIRSGYRREGIHPDYISFSPHQLTRFHGWLLANGIDLSKLRNGNCLDYGCGIGGALSFLAVQENTTYGVELDEMLAHYGRKNFGIEIVPRLENLPYGLQYDLIFSHNAIEHVYDPNEFFEFAACSLKSTGVMIIVLPAWRYSNTRLTIEEFNSAHNSMWDHVSLSKFLNRYGFYMTSHLYSNPAPGPNADWEICATAIRSKRKNYYEFTIDEVLYELRNAIPARHAERTAGTEPLAIERLGAINHELSVPAFS